MDDLAPTERLQPSLLDRLEDDEPDKRIEPREHRVLSFEQLRECILRDLGWLLNAEDHTAVNNLDDFPDAAASTINYGVPVNAGKMVTGADRRRMEESIRESILRFEPRLIGQSLQVKAKIDDSDMSKNALRFEIECSMWAQPLPLHLLVNAEVDVETGSFQVKSD